MEKVKKIPQRKCIGCAERRDKGDLVRVVRTPDGEGTVLEANVVAGTLKVRSNVESLAPKIYKRSECTYLRGGRRAPVEPDPDHT